MPSDRELLDRKDLFLELERARAWFWQLFSLLLFLGIILVVLYEPVIQWLGSYPYSDQIPVNCSQAKVELFSTNDSEHGLQNRLPDSTIPLSNRRQEITVAAQLNPIECATRLTFRWSLGDRDLLSEERSAIVDIDPSEIAGIAKKLCVEISPDGDATGKSYCLTVIIISE